MSSEKKVEASRANGKKSKGPLDTSSSRYNAKKHGLLSRGITEIDDIEYYLKLSRDLIRQKKPVGMLEHELLARAAYDMTGWKRAQRLEGEYITHHLNPALREKDPLADLDFQFNGAIVDPGIPASIGAGCVQEIVRTHQRYQTNIANRLFRTLHEFEREQRMRGGETLPAPIAVDVSVCAETGPLGSVNSSALPNDDVSSQMPVTLDADVQAHDGEAGSPAESQQEKAPIAELEPEKISPTKSEESQATLCKAASRQESVTLDADVQAYNGGAGSLAESEREKVPIAELEPEKIPPTKSEEPQTTLCKAASPRESVTLDADVQACNGGAGSPAEPEHQNAPTAELEQENVPSANVENFASPVVNAADIGSGSANKPPVAWRPPVKSGPIWSN
jgi:hypothetical protein